MRLPINEVLFKISLILPMAENNQEENQDSKSPLQQAQDTYDTARNAKRGFDAGKNLLKGGGNSAGAAGGEGAAAGAAGEVGVGAAGAGGGAAGVTGVGAAGGTAVVGGAAAGGGAAVAGGTAPVWVPIVAVAIGIILFVCIFVVAILYVLGIGNFGGKAEASSSLGGAPPGAAIGVVDNYCQNAQPICSKELKNIIENAAGWANMPGAVLLIVGRIEWSTAYGLSDADVLIGSAPGAGVEAIPSVGTCPEGDLVNTLADGIMKARGPMQFMPKTWEGTWGGVPATYFYGNAAVEAGVRPAGYNGNICNILDSYYAAAKKLKLDSGIPFDQRVLPWTKEQFSAAIAAYGSCSGPQDFNSCINTNYALYLSKANTVLGDGSIPTGWPTTGANTQTAYCVGMVTCFSHQTLSAVDIASSAGGVKVYATQNGTLEVGDSGDPSIDGYDATGAPIFNQKSLDDCRTRTRFGCTGLYALIRGDQYVTLYMHLDRTPPLSPCMLLNGQNIKVGTYLGIMGKTGYSTGVHTHYEIRDSLMNEIPNIESELNLVFPPEWKTILAPITTTYTGEACIR